MPLRVERVVHANVNCSDLARSLAFYEGLGLQRTIHTAPLEPQPGAVFGLEEAQWDAWILGDGSGRMSVDLLQWIHPPPVPASLREADDCGLSRLVLSGSQPGLLRDPDGTLLEIVDGEPGRLVSFVVNTSDPDFYTDVVGLPADAFTIELRPGLGGRPNTVPNALGWFRLALFVADIEREYAELVRLGVPCVSRPGSLDLGPGVPQCRAMLFSDPDGAVLELISL